MTVKHLLGPCVYGAQELFWGPNHGGPRRQWSGHTSGPSSFNLKGASVGHTSGLFISRTGKNA
ncbi:unnamed protein product, partial [Pleuronectes platessa]